MSTIPLPPPLPPTTPEATATTCAIPTPLYGTNGRVSNGNNINDHWSPLTKKELEQALLHGAHTNGGNGHCCRLCHPTLLHRYSFLLIYVALFALACIAALVGWIVYRAALADLDKDYEEVVVAACGERATAVRLTGEQAGVLMTSVLSMVTSSFAQAGSFTVALFTRFILSQDTTSKGFLNLSWQSVLHHSQRSRFEANYFPVTALINNTSVYQTIMDQYIVDITTLPAPIVSTYIGRDVSVGVRQAYYNQSLYDLKTRTLPPTKLLPSMRSAIVVLIPVNISTIGLDNDEWVVYAQAFNRSQYCIGFIAAAIDLEPFIGNALAAPGATPLWVTVVDDGSTVYAPATPQPLGGAVANTTVRFGDRTWTVSCISESYPSHTTPAAYAAMVSLFVFILPYLFYRLYTIRTLYSRLESATDMNSQIASSTLSFLCHELRNPLQGIVGMNEELLGDERLTPDQMDVMHTISASTQIMVAILNDAVDLNKVERGLELEKHTFDFARLVSNVDTVYRSFVPSAVQWTVNLDPGIPRMLMGDPTRIQQMLLTLIANAMKLTSSGSITLHITRLIDGGDTENGDGHGQQHHTTSAGSHPDVHLRFAVVDTGVGIPSADWPLLFETVGHFDGGVLHNFTGAQGLGLRLVKALAEKMGGRIRLWSEVGVGSEFSFDAWLTRANNNPIFVFDDLTDNDDPEESVSTTATATIHPGDRFMPSSAQPHARRLFAESSRSKPHGIDRVLSSRAGIGSTNGQGSSTTPMASSRAGGFPSSWPNNGQGDYCPVDEGDEACGVDANSMAAATAPSAVIDGKSLPNTVTTTTPTTATTPKELGNGGVRSRGHSRMNSRELTINPIGGSTIAGLVSAVAAAAVSSSSSTTSSMAGNNGIASVTINDQVTTLSGIGFAGLGLTSMTPAAAVAATTASANSSGTSPPLSGRRSRSGSANRDRVTMGNNNNNTGGSNMPSSRSSKHLIQSGSNTLQPITPKHSATAPSPNTITRHLPGSVSTPATNVSLLSNNSNSSSNLTSGLSNTLSSTPTRSTNHVQLLDGTPPSVVRTLVRRSPLPLSSATVTPLVNPVASPPSLMSSNLGSVGEPSENHSSSVQRGSLALLNPDNGTGAPVMRPSFRSPRANPLTSKTIKRQLGTTTTNSSRNTQGEHIIPLRTASSRTNVVVNTSVLGNNNNNTSDGVTHGRDNSVSSLQPLVWGTTSAATTTVTTSTATSATDSTSYLSSSSASSNTSMETGASHSIGITAAGGSSSVLAGPRVHQMMGRAPSNMATNVTARAMMPRTNNNNNEAKWESDTPTNGNNNGTETWIPHDRTQQQPSTSTPPSYPQQPHHHHAQHHPKPHALAYTVSGAAAAAAAAQSGVIQYPVNIPDLNITGYLTLTMNPPNMPSPVFAAGYPGSPPTQAVAPPNLMAAALAAVTGSNNNNDASNGSNNNSRRPSASTNTPSNSNNSHTSMPPANNLTLHPHSLPTPGSAMVNHSHPLHGHHAIQGHSPSPVSGMYSASVGSSSSQPLDSGRSTPGAYGSSWPRPASTARSGSSASAARDTPNTETPTPPWVVFHQHNNGGNGGNGSAPPTSGGGVNSRYGSPRHGAIPTMTLGASAMNTTPTKNMNSEYALSNISLRGPQSSSSGGAAMMNQSQSGGPPLTPISAASAAQSRLLALSGGGGGASMKDTNGGNNSNTNDSNGVVATPLSPNAPAAPPAAGTGPGYPQHSNNALLQVASFSGTGSMFSPPPPNLHLNLPVTPHPSLLASISGVGTMNGSSSGSNSSSSNGVATISKRPSLTGTPGSITSGSNSASSHHSGTGAHFAAAAAFDMLSSPSGGLTSPDSVSPPPAGVAMVHGHHHNGYQSNVNMPLPMGHSVPTLQPSLSNGVTNNGLSSLLSPHPGGANDSTAYTLSPPGPTSRAPLTAGGGTLGPLTGGRAALPSSSSSSTSPPHGRDTKHILLVEDNMVNQKAARRTLDRLGVQVSVANDGIEAVDAAAKTKFDLILMDLNMPRMGGIDATKRIRALITPNGRVPIVAVTAQALDKPQCMEAGMDGFMTKPLTMVALRELIVRHTGADLGSEQTRPASRVANGAATGGRTKLQRKNIPATHNDGSNTAHNGGMIMAPTATIQASK